MGVPYFGDPYNKDPTIQGTIWEFPKMGVPYFGGPDNKDPTI